MYQIVPKGTALFWAKMSRPIGAKLRQIGLDDELVERFLDFCEGYEGAPAHRLLCRAMEAYMAERYDAEPEVRRRAEEARKKRTD
jgi:hypothetical protein